MSKQFELLEVVAYDGDVLLRIKHTATARYSVMDRNATRWVRQSPYIWRGLTLMEVGYATEESLDDALPFVSTYRYVPKIVVA